MTQLTHLIRRIVIPSIVIAAAAAGAGAARAGDWSQPVEVQHELKRCVSYRARLAGDFLIIQADIEPGWHTFTMDNKKRSDEKLAGRKSLGVDGPTEITLSDGLKTTGPWYQTPPKDFSKPELRWFSWGFEDQARFVAKVRPAGAGPARIAVRGQTCTDTVCKNIDIEISLPLGGAGAGDPSGVDLNTLVQVR